METWAIAVTCAALLAALAPRYGLYAQYRHWRRFRERADLEDALKHLLEREQRGAEGGAASVAAALRISHSNALMILGRMEARGLAQPSGTAVRLTPEGERLALQIVRAHRLWERYLADEAGVPLIKVHGVAERAEHGLSAEALEVLDARLGHPLQDPHGDPIPRPDGTLPRQQTMPLTDWETGETAEVFHLEDEPEVVFKQIQALGLHPGSLLRVLEREPGHLLVSDFEHEHRLAPVVAANIHVAPARRLPGRPEGLARLTELADGEEAEVAGIDARYRGFGRRRLLDLGLTPGARVRVALDNAFGDPRAFRVRGTLVALRNTQAKQIWVRRRPGESEGVTDEVARA